jgi:hypothetical protein
MRGSKIHHFDLKNSEQKLEPTYVTDGFLLQNAEVEVKMAILQGIKKRHTNVRLFLELTLGHWKERLCFSSYIQRIFQNIVSDLHPHSRSNFQFYCMYMYEENLLKFVTLHAFES